jgi:DNA-binding response OmpR family regulator
MRLLVAENDPALATFLQEGFDHEHYAVDLTGDGDDAKYWIERRHYDLAILDLDMERGRGTHVLQFVRAKRSQLPILVLSSQSRAEDYARVLDLGADDLILKPFLFPELAARVRRAAQGREFCGNRVVAGRFAVELRGPLREARWTRD